jgi:DNA-binding MarR family transcriptional regulator
MMTRSSEGEAATRVILATFRANGLLLAAGDVLSRELGLTSARWQVLGAVAMSDQPLTVPQIARRMGLTRQSVHATVGRLVTDGLLRQTPNIDHRRSPHVAMTAAGEERWHAIRARQATWVNRLAAGLAADELRTTERVLQELSRRLDGAGHHDAGPAPDKEER